MVPIVNFDILHKITFYTDFLLSISEVKKKEVKESESKRDLSESGFSFKPEKEDDPLIPNQI